MSKDNVAAARSDTTELNSRKKKSLIQYKEKTKRFCCSLFHRSPFSGDVLSHINEKSDAAVWRGRTSAKLVSVLPDDEHAGVESGISMKV